MWGFEGPKGQKNKEGEHGSTDGRCNDQAVQASLLESERDSSTRFFLIRRGQFIGGMVTSLQVYWCCLAYIIRIEEHIWESIQTEGEANREKVAREV